MSPKSDPERQLQDYLDELRDQVLHEMSAVDQEAFIENLREQIDAGNAERNRQQRPALLQSRPWMVAAAVLLIGLATAIMQPWDGMSQKEIETPPSGLLKELALIQSLSLLDPEVLAQLNSVDLGAATMVFENELDVPYDLLLAAVEEE